MKTKFFFLFLLISIIALQGCSKAECKTDEDCLKPHFTSICMDDVCVHTPIPNECGNGLCEPGETKCNCEIDCGICAGSSGQFKLACVGEECVESLPESIIKPTVSVSDINAGGDTFSLQTTYNQPFNLYKDLFNVRITLGKSYPKNSDRKISKISLFGQSDRQTIPLGEKILDRNIWPGSEIDTGLVLDFPTAEKSGEFTNLELQITYEYLTGTAVKTAKSTVMKKSYRTNKLNWVKPSKPYPCPETCDDNNPGTQDVCDESTNFRCEYRPIPGACGNFICDETENQCTCPTDCGPCESDAGTYTVYACVSNACVSQLRPSIKKTPKSLFDDRNLNVFHLQNNYIYKDPFDVTKDKLQLEFELYNRQESVSDIKITNTRLFVSTNEIASKSPDLVLPNTGASGTVELSIPKQSVPENSVALNLKVWYEYTQDGNVKKGSYSKPLGKITLLSPGLKK